MGALFCPHRVMYGTRPGARTLLVEETFSPRRVCVRAFFLDEMEDTLSGHDTKRQQHTTTTTSTETRPESDGQDFDVLTPQEEKVLRMLHGLSESGEHELKFALGADADVKLKLAMMERELQELFSPDDGDDDLLD